MNLPPLAVHTRVAWIALAAVVFTLFMTASSIVRVATVVISDTIDVRLDTQLDLLGRTITDRGTIDAALLARLPNLARPSTNWGWLVLTPAGRWHRGVLLGSVDFPRPRVHEQGGAYSGRGTARNGSLIHLRRRDYAIGAGLVSVIVIAPHSIITEEVHRVRAATIDALLRLFVVLLLATVLQVAIGLKPLRRLHADVVRVRNGEATALPTGQPAELRPVVSEMNALIARNDAGLQASRVAAANLAHAVKTPLATLLLQLEQEGAGRESLELVAIISHRVAHHLQRLRSGAVGLGVRARSDLWAVADDIRATMRRTMVARSIEIEIRVPPPCGVAVDAEDLGEMLGNLVENACRFAAGRVVIAAQVEGRAMAVHIEDDGNGIPEDAMDAVLSPGHRLDENAGGYGFGLAIVRELAELYGGALVLARSAELGGLRVILRLPR